jgi:hypothetical protein
MKREMFPLAGKASVVHHSAMRPFLAIASTLVSSVILLNCGGEEFSGSGNDGGAGAPDASVAGGSAGIAGAAGAGAAGVAGTAGSTGGSAGVSGGAGAGLGGAGLGGEGGTGQGGGSGTGGAAGAVGSCADWCGKGTCEGQLCVLATQLSWGDRIVADEEFIYVNTHDAIRRVRKDGAAAPEVFNQVYGDYNGIALTSTHLYFTRGAGKSLGRMAKNGTGVQNLTSLTGEPDSLALDDKYVYWVERQANAADIGRLARIPLAGGSTELIIDQRTRPHEVAVDDTTIYWIEEAGVFSCSKGALQCTADAPIATAGEPHWRPSLLLFGSTIWFTGWGEILTVPKSGGLMTQVTPVVGSVRGLFLDSTGAFWTEDKVTKSGKVQFLGSAEGAKTVDIATGQHSPVAVISDNGFVYWLNEGAEVSGTYEPGSLVKAKYP